MTRRVLLALLALTTSVLVAAVIPLGLKAARQELSAYVDDARAVARAAAAVAEEGLADHKPSPDMGRVLAAARRDGDTLIILNAKGEVVASVGSPGAIPAWLVGEAVGGRELETDVRRGYVSVVVPVRETTTVVGTVSLARPLGPLNDRVRTLWFTLSLIAAAALAASALLAFALARWVSRPLAELDASAQRLGAGDLAVRAGARAGPPELRRLAASFNSMGSRLETLVHRNRAMVADVSHQLRTPLTALRLRFDLLAEDADPAIAAELGGALEEFDRLSRLVDGLLAVAKAEHAVPAPVPVDVRAVVAERVTAWQPVADDRGVSLVSEATGQVIAAIGDGQLEQILDNLIANALDATAAGDHVTVSARAPSVRAGRSGSTEATRDRMAPAAGNGGAGAGSGGGVRVVVADDGPGMSANERARAFGRFTTASPGGTGLGLAIVYRLVSSNGGTACLDETSGGGLSVIMEFTAVPSVPSVPSGAAPPV
ncbi:MAG TPA: HAMP domain-containing sensor histidine kinase [Streptosporangiaceae bacterium]|nr:HAMP domain-containing sensor histidine kinase [Streptosporangiaceae bacterium]